MLLEANDSPRAAARGSAVVGRMVPNEGCLVRLVNQSAERNKIRRWAEHADARMRRGRRLVLRIAWMGPSSLLVGMGPSSVGRNVPAALCGLPFADETTCAEQVPFAVVDETTYAAATSRDTDRRQCSIRVMLVDLVRHANAPDTDRRPREARQCSIYRPREARLDRVGRLSWPGQGTGANALLSIRVILV